MTTHHGIDKMMQIMKKTIRGVIVLNWHDRFIISALSPGKTIKVVPGVACPPLGPFKH